MYALNDRFSESSMTLLLGMAYLDPSDLFSNFEKHKIPAWLGYILMILKVKAGCMEGLSIQLDKILETIR
jgi:hypothetical protein